MVNMQRALKRTVLFSGSRKRNRRIMNLAQVDVTEPNQDFATVCHYADLDHSLVRSKVKRTLNRIEDNYAKKDMSELQREWVSKGNRNERALRISRAVNKAV